MNYELRVAPLVLKCDLESLNVLVLGRFVRKRTQVCHVFINGRENSDEIVQQVDITDEDVEYDDDCMEVFICANNVESVIAKHSVEERASCYNEANVVDCVFLEQYLEDRNHDNDVADCKCDE